MGLNQLRGLYNSVYDSFCAIKPTKAAYMPLKTNW